jgi:hypothetical protein
VPKTFGGTVGHLLAHRMHHRAQIMILSNYSGIGQLKDKSYKVQR